MDGTVRYVRSRDGTRIAYSVLGEGPVLGYLHVPSVSHIELYPRLKGGREYLESLRRGRALVRIDFRGTGMSDREFADHSPEALTDDLEAVLDDLEVTEMDLLAGGVRVTPALGLMLRRKGLVSRLVLGYPFSVQPVGLGQPAQQGMLHLMEVNWELFLEFTTQRNTGRPVGEMNEAMSHVRRCIDQHNYVAEIKAARYGDDWELAAEIDVPVLVIDFANNVLLPTGLMQAYAGRFRHGKFIALPEGTLVPPYGNPELFVQAVMEFLGPAPVGVRGRDSASRALSPREVQVLRLIVRGRTNVEIADALVISRHTVGRHLSNIFDKIDAANRTDAAAWAVRNGLADEAQARQ